MEKREFLTGASLVTIGLVASMRPADAHKAKATCDTDMNDWAIYTDVTVSACCVPIETDYDTRAEFEKKIKDYGGYGKQKDGSYIRWVKETGGWDVQAHNMDMHGRHMSEETLAVDPNWIAHEQWVHIPGLPGKYNHLYYAHDSGDEFVGKKEINFMLGEGEKACADRDCLDDLDVLGPGKTIFVYKGSGKPGMVPISS